MKGIKFKAAYGDQGRVAVISQGSLNGIHIYVNGYYQGTINCIMGKCGGHWRPPTENSVTRIVTVSMMLRQYWTDCVMRDGWNDRGLKAVSFLQ